MYLSFNKYNGSDTNYNILTRMVTVKYYNIMWYNGIIQYHCNTICLYSYTVDFIIYILLYSN